MPDEIRGVQNRGINENATGERSVTSRMISARQAALDILGVGEAKQAPNQAPKQAPDQEKTVRLVFYEGFKDAPDSGPSFKGYADVIA